MTYKIILILKRLISYARMRLRIVLDAMNIISAKNARKSTMLLNHLVLKNAFLVSNLGISVIHVMEIAAWNVRTGIGFLGADAT